MQHIITNTQYKPLYALQANYRRHNLGAKLAHQTKHAHKVCLVTEAPRYAVLTDLGQYYVGKLGVGGRYWRDSKNMCKAFADKLAAARNSK